MENENRWSSILLPALIVRKQWKAEACMNEGRLMTRGLYVMEKPVYIFEFYNKMMH